MALEKSPGLSVSLNSHLQSGRAALTGGVCVRIKQGNDCKNLEQHVGAESVLSKWQLSEMFQPEETSGRPSNRWKRRPRKIREDDGILCRMAKILESSGSPGRCRLWNRGRGGCECWGVGTDHSSFQGYDLRRVLRGT